MKKSIHQFLFSFALIASTVSSVAQTQIQDTFDSVLNGFTEAGYMGCTANIDINPTWDKNPKTGPLCYRIEFLNSCQAGWAGVYWTNRTDDTGANWGQYPGTNLKDYKRLTFWAKSESERSIVELGIGGIDNTLKEPEKYKYKDSILKTYTTEGKVVILNKEWRKFTIDLTNSDLSSMIGGFFWSANWRANPTGLVFYLDNIQFEK